MPDRVMSNEVVDERPRVLVVDDRPENLLALEAALEPLGVETVRAATPARALEEAARRDFAVVLLDVQMPGMDGHEVARRMKLLERARLTPIIFVTALDREAHQLAEGYESGGVDYLFKPLDPDLLRAKVRAFVELWEQRAAEVRRLRTLFADLRSGRARAESERDRLLYELERERSRLATVLRDAPAFLAIVRGPDHVFELANNAYYELVDNRDLIGRPVKEALPEAARQGFIGILDRVFESGEPYVGREVPMTFEGPGGVPPRTRFLDFTYLPLVEPDGTTSGVVAYGLDVTDHVAARKQAEQARDRVARLQSLTAALAEANTPEAIAEVVVAEGVAATRATTGLFAVRAPGTEQARLLRSRGFPESYRAEWRDFSITAESPVAEAMRTGGAIFIESEGELHGRFSALQPLWTELGTRAIATIPLSVGGETVGAMSFTFDRAREFTPEDRDFYLTLGRQAAVATERARLITALTEQREAALTARAEAEEAAAAKSQFLATMSHELRTPINAQIGYTQLLAMEIAGPLTDEQRTYLTRLARSSDHLLTLINDVLDLSKIEAGELKAERVEAWTGPAVDAALELTRPLADARQLRITDSRDRPTGVQYVGDEQRVRQVVVNLLSNAVKFTEPGGSITIECGVTGDTPPGAGLHGRGPWAFIRVADTGIGISADQLVRIFEPFTQVEAGHTRKQGGTGLGLAISRRLARIMGGDLVAESELGKGSTFTLWLPAVAEAADAARRRESAAERRARADRVVASIEAPGLDRIGTFIKEAAEEILEAYANRLRTDPLTPAARALRQPEVEDHQASLLMDLAQSLSIISDAGPAASDLLRDGSAIQRVIAEHHGARRYTQGWSEAAVHRDNAIMREEIERAVRRRFRTTGDLTTEAETADVEEAIQVLIGLIERAELVSVRGWRQAALGSR